MRPESHWVAKSLPSFWFHLPERCPPLESQVRIPLATETFGSQSRFPELCAPASSSASPSGCSQWKVWPAHCSKNLMSMSESPSLVFLIWFVDFSLWLQILPLAPWLTNHTPHSLPDVALTSTLMPPVWEKGLRTPVTAAAAASST